MSQHTTKPRISALAVPAWITSALLVLLTAASPVSAPASAGSTGKAFPRLEPFQSLAPAELYRQTLETVSRRTPIILRFHYRDLCGATKGTAAWSLGAITSAVYERANAFAEKMQACPDTCAPSVNAAQFCGYVGDRQREILALQTWDKGFFEAYNLLTEAGQKARLPEEQLRTGFRLIATPALEWLAEAMKNGGTTRDDRHTLAREELHAFRLMLLTLSGEGILQGETGAVREALDTALAGLTMEPPGKRNILRAAAELAWVERTLDHSARQAAMQREATPDTRAAAPAATLPGQRDWKQAAACFERLSLDASTAVGGIQSELELILSCRDTSECPATAAARQPGIETLLSVVDRSFKAQYALTGSMCRPE